MAPSGSIPLTWLKMAKPSLDEEKILERKRKLTMIQKDNSEVLERLAKKFDHGAKKEY
jgi:hypothetical protein